MPKKSPQCGYLSALQYQIGTEVSDLGRTCGLYFGIHPDLRIPQDDSHMFPRPKNARENQILRSTLVLRMKS